MKIVFYDDFKLGLVEGDSVIDASEMVVTPGFINGHMHISYAHATRGIFPDDLGDFRAATQEILERHDHLGPRGELQLTAAIFRAADERLRRIGVAPDLIEEADDVIGDLA